METTFEVRGARLAATVFGSGTRSFIWSHGLISSRAAEDALGIADWTPVAAAKRVVRYDARGHGRSSSGVPDSLRWSELALDMIGVADAAGIDRFVAGGASMGCATALHAAVLAPERVEALVLQIPPTGWETRAAQSELYAGGAAFLETMPQRALEFIAAGVDTTPPLGAVMAAAFPQATAIMKEQILALDPARLATAFAGAARSDLPDREDVARVEAPALILAWLGDPGHPLGTAEELHALLPNSELHIGATFEDVQGWGARIASWP